jgi:PA14 domain
MSRILRTIPTLGGLMLLALMLAAAPPDARAQSTTSFTGEYFNNPGLNGTPVFVRDDPSINFNWGAGSPDPSIPTDNFSVRWTRWYYFNPAGSYTFTMTSDDGGRLWIDGALLIDMWWDHAPLARATTLSLTAGYHLVRMEYYEHTGGAQAQLAITSSASYPDWKGEYYDNQVLAGSPKLTINNAAINFNWGTGSPDPLIPSNHFSARWTRNQWFDAGTYKFTATADDGIRVWVGGTVLIDQWHDQPPTTYTLIITLPAGESPLRVEYYQDTGGAVAIFAWAPVAAGGSAWTGRYFNNPSLSGAPVFVRSDPNLNFNWGTSGPAAGISAGNFSAKWDSVQNASSATFYSVYVTVDDGVRVSVDGALVIDQWRDQSPTSFAATMYLAAGPHTWQVEYYQHLGGAQISVQIAPGVSPPPPTAPASGDIIVDDGGSGWLAGGNASSWRSASGYGGHSVWTFNDAFIQPLYDWARWYPALPQARNYEVFAYVPADAGSTRNARYWISHAGAYDLQSIAQAFSPNQWVSLGTYYFAAAGGEYVSLSDVTYECHLCYTVAFDAIRFSPR